MKTSIKILFALLLFPLISNAQFIPDGKKFEVIGIFTFVTFVALIFTGYYFWWKAQKNKVRDRYVIKTTQYVKNGRVFVKSQKIKIPDGPSSLQTGKA
jgi:hypothetical protein